ncbi:MAG TPA: hypothetical protein VGL56_04985 [Fimbriimonadaceae bacterium]|jgi:hypothetical protein
MKKIAAGIVSLALIASFAVAAGPTKAATCPACKMTLSKHKDKVHTVAVKIKGKTMYCCAGCAMNKKKK